MHPPSTCWCLFDVTYAVFICVISTLLLYIVCSAVLCFSPSCSFLLFCTDLLCCCGVTSLQGWLCAYMCPPTPLSAASFRTQVYYRLQYDTTSDWTLGSSTGPDGRCASFICTRQPLRRILLLWQLGKNTVPVLTPYLFTDCCSHTLPPWCCTSTHLCTCTDRFLRESFLYTATGYWVRLEARLKQSLPGVPDTLTSAPLLFRTQSTLTNTVSQCPRVLSSTGGLAEVQVRITCICP